MTSLGDGSINSDDDGEKEEAAEPGEVARYRQKVESSNTEISIIILSCIYRRRACDIQSKYLSTWIRAKICLVFVFTQCAGLFVHVYVWKESLDEDTFRSLRPALRESRKQILSPKILDLTMLLR